MVADPMMPARPPRWRRCPDLRRGGGEGCAEECYHTNDRRRQHFHHPRRPATRRRSAGRCLTRHAAQRIIVAPIGSIVPPSTDQIENCGPHIQILFMSNSGMRCAGERAGAL